MALGLCFGAMSQTTVYSEDFTSGSTWTLNTITGAEGTYPNNWYISCQEDGQMAGACGTACAISDNSLHVGPNAILGDLGAAYFEGLATTTERRAESGNINTLGESNLTLSFDMIGGGNAQDFTELFYSNDGGTSWFSIVTPLTSATCPSGQGLWQTNTYTLPAACENISNLRIAFVWQNFDDGIASDPSFAVDDILITSPSAASNTITTVSNIAPTSWCEGSATTLQVNFTSTGTFTAGNIYSAELSDATGSFAAPTVIGTLTSSANSGMILSIVPGSTPAGSGYRIRVVSDSPATIGSDNGVDIVINPPPTVTISTMTNVCQTDPSFTLTGGSPSGGTYSGPGVSGGIFDPLAAGPGTHSISYSYTDANGCSGQAVETITVDNCVVNTITTVSNITPTSWCEGQVMTLQVNFTSTGTFNAGNTYSAELSDAAGSFVAPTVIGTLNSSTNSGMILSIVPGSTPAGSGYRIRVVSDDPATIGSDNGVDLIINALPIVSLGTYTSVCVYTPTFNLTGGLPSGGTYSGNGVTGGAIDPAVAGIGAHNITYTYVDANGCENSATQSIVVDGCLGVEELSSVHVTLYPNPANSEFSISGTDADRVELIDNQGKLVKVYNSQSENYSLENVQTGVYTVLIYSNTSRLTTKLVVN